MTCDLSRVEARRAHRVEKPRPVHHLPGRDDGVEHSRIGRLGWGIAAAPVAPSCVEYGPEPATDGASRDRIQALEEELSYTKERLQSAVRPGDTVARLAVPGYTGVTRWGMVVFVPLWFLGVYAAVVLLAPATAWLHQRAAELTIVGLGAAIALVDLGRFGAEIHDACAENESAVQDGVRRKHTPVQLDLGHEPLVQPVQIRIAIDRTGRCASVAQILGHVAEAGDRQRRLQEELEAGMLVRDVGEDARKNRIYLPMDDLKRFGVPAADILQARETPAFAELMAFEAARAREHYGRAMQALPAQDRKAQRPGLVMAAIYRTLLDEIEGDGWRVLTQRTSLTPLRKLWIAWKTWLKG